MNRETNTIGSKCQDVAITRLVVEHETEIEKIREQIQNHDEVRSGGIYETHQYRLWQYGQCRPRGGIVSPDSAPVKRLIKEARKRGC